MVKCVRPNAGLGHRFCNAIHDSALFGAAQHALNLQIKSYVSGRKGAVGIRPHETRTRFDKPFGNAAAIHFIGNDLRQMGLHAAEIGYGRKRNAQFTTNAGCMIQRIYGTRG